MNIIVLLYIIEYQFKDYFFLVFLDFLALSVWVVNEIPIVVIIIETMWKNIKGVVMLD